MRPAPLTVLFLALALPAGAGHSLEERPMKKLADLEAAVKRAKVAWDKIETARVKADAACNKASVARFKAESAWDNAYASWVKADAALTNAKNRREV